MKIAFASIGAPFFAQYMANITDQQYIREKDLESPNHKDINLFLVGLYSPYRSFYSHLNKYFKNVIILFAGSDLLRLNDMSLREREKLFEVLKRHKCVFATESLEIHKRIHEEYSLNTSIIYLPSKYEFEGEPYPLPRQFTMGCYMPCGVQKGESARFFYGFSTLIEVVKQMPDINFYFYDRDGYTDYNGETKMKNVISCEKGITDMPGFLKNISCGVRLVKHDTYSMSAIEYNMAGRWFINNHPMPFCDKISHNSSVAEIKQTIYEVMKRKKLNIEGMNFYRQTHRKEDFLEKIESIFNFLIENKIKK